MRSKRLTVLATIIGFIVGILFFQVTERGLLIHWKSLGIPPKDITELSAFNYPIVYFKTINNSYRSCNILSLVDCWQENQSPQENFATIESCQDNEISYLIFGKPKSEITSCKHAASFVPEHFISDYFVITENGEIWVWHFFSPSIFQSYLINFPSFTLIGAVIGFVIARLVKKNDKNTKGHKNNNVSSS